MPKKSLNFVFAGNPGTGKTTVARLFGRLLVDLGLRPPGVFVEKTGQSLLTEGSVKFKDTLKAATPGVLFIDEVIRLILDEFVFSPRHIMNAAFVR